MENQMRRKKTKKKKQIQLKNYSKIIHLKENKRNSLEKQLKPIHERGKNVSKHK
jgi:hypothetical protein